MKKEDCKVGTLVRARNGSSVGKIVEVNDETSNKEKNKTGSEQRPEKSL